jgi:hypothetical protein
MSEIKLIKIQSLSGMRYEVPIPRPLVHTINFEWADMLEEALPRLVVMAADDDWESRKDQSWNICATLCPDPPPYPKSEALRNEISRRIIPFSFFSSWMIVGNNVSLSDYMLQQARKAWMLDMIAEFRGQQK